LLCDVLGVVGGGVGELWGGGGGGGGGGGATNLHIILFILLHSMASIAGGVGNHGGQIH
jgi:hypothetical protein